MSRHGGPSPRGYDDDRRHAASDLFGGNDPDRPDDLDRYVDDTYENEPGGSGAYGSDRDAGHPSGPLPVSRSGRRAAKSAARRRRRRRVVLALVIVVILGLGVGAYELSGRLFDFGGGPDDYTGQGSGSVSVTVAAGDGAAAIGQTLADAGVVASADAFTAAAAADSRSVGIQPGVYAMRTRMSAAAALALLLDPSARQTETLLIREGATETTVLTDLATALQVPLEQVQQAAAQIDQIGIPTAYLTPTAPTSLEGFLFPATYSFDPGTTPLAALQEIVVQFTNNDRQTGFSSAAAGLGLTPYQLLTAASIAQAELKFPEDAGKVVRVILNRIAIGRPLQVDPTSVYGARLNGVDPATIDYATYPTPYNTYLNAGLPPGPINSPGATELTEAAAPDAGDWIYYVTGDDAGHLFFTADENEFLAAAQRCADAGWGCADQGGG